jgi:hypothetical protein
MSADQMRKEFEAWFSDDGAWPKACARSADGDYIHMSASTSWTAWQAAYAAARKDHVPLSIDGNSVYIDGLGDVALATQPQGAVTDAERYKKLRRWMSSNVKEGWTEVENLGAIAAYMGWDEMDKALDGLPMCTVGLCSLPAAPKTETPEGEQ